MAEIFGEDKVFLFLDNIRDSGETNMFGSIPFIQDEFGVSEVEARGVLRKWMDTFNERHPQ